MGDWDCSLSILMSAKAYSYRCYLCWDLAADACLEINSAWFINTMCLQHGFQCSGTMSHGAESAVDLPNVS